MATTSVEDVVVMGGAREALQTHGAWDGREEEELDVIIRSAIAEKRLSVQGTVSRLCVSPANGSRIPCDHVLLSQSLKGDCTSTDLGTQLSGVGNDLKNGKAARYLDEEFLFVEGLLSGVAVADADLVQEVVSGPKSERVMKSEVHASAYSEVWCTGDNMYLQGMDMSWDNFHIGDLLVTPQAVILNTGYPHQACWKYAARCGSEAREYVNDEAGIFFRLRGFKGALLLPTTQMQAMIRTRDECFIVRKGSAEYHDIVNDCRPPLDADTQVRFKLGPEEMFAAAHDTAAYIKLLVCAGCEAARVDARKHRRPLPEIVSKQLGIVAQSSKL